MDVLKLSRALEKGPIAPIYLVSGEEDALVDRAVEQISKRVLSDARTTEFAHTRLEGKSTTAEEVENASRTASLFGGRRLVVVRDAQTMKAAEMEKLLRYLHQPVSMTTLLMVFRGVDAGSRSPRLAKGAALVKKVLKAVEKGGGISVECPRPKPRDLPRLAEQLLAEQGLKATRDGLAALVESIGEDWGALEHASVKLALYLGGQGEVTERAVAEVVANTRIQSIFALTDAVGEGSTERALRVLQGMVREGESPLGILSQIARHFRNLARVLALSERGQTEEQIRAELGLHPFVIKKCLHQARRFDQRTLADRIQLLAETDRKLKSSPLPDALRMDSLVLRLCRKERAAR